MATEPQGSSGHNHDELLDEPLRTLRQAGLERPPHLTLQQYLQRLAREGVASPHTVTAYLVLYQEFRYGAHTIDPGSARQIVERLTDELQAMREWPEPELQRVRDALHLDLRPDDAPTPPAGVDERDVIYLPMQSGDTTTPDRSGKVRLSPRALVLLIGWSLLMLAMGYAQRHQIGSLVNRFSSGDSEESVFMQLVQQEIMLMRVYERELTKTPEDPTLLNNYAWLLATARTHELRDVDRALDMATRAYELQPAPHIADTLAEVLFQHGDIRRAIELEERALAEAGNGRQADYYRQQLARFRRALSASSAAPEVPIPEEE